MKRPQTKTGFPGVDRSIAAIVQAMDNELSRGVCLTTDLRTVSATTDAMLLKVKTPIKLESITLFADTTISIDAANYWEFKVIRYRPGVTEPVNLRPLSPFDDGTEVVSTAKVPITAHAGLEIPFDNDLQVGDSLELSIIKVSAAANLVSFMVQTDLTRAR